jgi:Response regulator containing CheY-like receiver, AAA-type ATPase, and DNA-binding domains
MNERFIAANGSKKRILLIDDEKSILDSLKMMLTFEGYDVAAAESVNLAIKFLEEEDF